MTEQEKEQQFKDKIAELEKMVRDLAEEKATLQTKLYGVERDLRDCALEKDRLLDIIANLSKAMANQ